jgi:cell division protein FtsN
MKKTLLLFSFLLFMIFSLNNCKFIRTKILGKPDPADTLAAWHHMMDSLQRVDSINAIEQARLDSMEMIRQQAKADSLAKADSIRQAKLEAEKNKYHIISGSFRNSSYADRYNQRMQDEYGYDSKIVVANNGFNLVSIKSHPSMSAAIRELRNIRDEGRFEAWVYAGN